MFRDIFFHLILNLVYFLSFGYLINRIKPFTLSRKSSFKSKMIYSTIFGLSAVGAILLSYDIAGVKVDIRLVPITLAGLYGGPMVAFLTSLWPMFYRIISSGVTEITIVAAVTMISSGLIAGYIGKWDFKSIKHQIVGSFMLATYYSIGLFLFFSSNQNWESFLNLILVFATTYILGILFSIDQIEYFVEGYKLKKELQAQKEILEGKNDLLEEKSRELIESNGNLAALNEELITSQEELIEVVEKLDIQAKGASMAENRLTAVLDSVDEGVIVTNLEGQLIHVSKRAESLLEFDNGYPEFNVLKSEENGTCPSIIKAIVNTKEYQDTIKAIDDNPAVMFETVFNIYAEYGKVITRYTSPVIDKTTGKILGRVYVYRDMTTEYQRELESLRLIEATKEQAITDHLTGLYNKKYLEEYLVKELENKLNHPLSMLVLDVDKFKEINDTYGHLVGDEVLVALTKTIKETVRNSDIVGRYGGEEFEVLLPKTNYDCALNVAEKVRKSIENQVFVTTAGELKLTISTGVATCPIHGTNKMDLFEAGDKALYKAKEWGKNQVVGYQLLIEKEKSFKEA